MGPSRALRGWRRGLGFRAFLHRAAASSSGSGANPTPREWGEAKLGRKQAAWWRFRIKPPPPLPAGCCCLRRRLAGSARRSLRQGLLLDRSGVRFRYTSPIWPVTGRNRSNSNLNSNFAVQPVRTGIPAGLAGNRSNSIFFSFFGLNSNARKVY